MAQSPKYIDTPFGRVHVTYVRLFVTRVPVRFCFLHQASIEHSCDEFGCWDFDEEVR